MLLLQSAVVLLIVCSGHVFALEHGIVWSFPLLHRTGQSGVVIRATRLAAIWPRHHDAQLLFQHAMFLLQGIDHELRGWELLAGRPAPCQLGRRATVWHCRDFISRIICSASAIQKAPRPFIGFVEISVVIQHFGFFVCVSVCLPFGVILTKVAVL